MRERSLSEETGMGALLRPKGVGTCALGRRAGRATMRCCGCACGSSSEVSILKTCGRCWRRSSCTWKWSTAPDSCIWLRGWPARRRCPCRRPPPLSSPSCARPHSARPRSPRPCPPAPRQPKQLPGHLRSSLPARSSRGSTSEGLPINLWRRHLVGRRRQSRRPPRNPQRAVQPVASAPQDVEGLVLGDASSRSCSARSSSRNDPLSRLNAALPQQAPERRGPRRV